jgi:hypothetical protein
MHKEQVRYAPATAQERAHVPVVKVWDRLKEISMFFERRDRVHQTTRRLVRRFEKAGIPYAIAGAMAVNLHGARRTTDDVDFLLTQQGFDRCVAEFVGKEIGRVEGRPRRFVDLKNGVTFDILITGRYPGSGKPGPIAFPDPSEASTTIENTRVLTLQQLIQLKLAARRHYDFGDVVFLIRVHHLDESFTKQLHPSVQRDYMKCLEEKRREDEYEARL